MIETLVNDCLSSRDDTVKAVACYDLGEFSKYVPNGKMILERHNVRIKMTELMGNQEVSAEVKKEAITCYQKLLMTSWSSSSKAKPLAL